MSKITTKYILRLFIFTIILLSIGELGKLTLPGKFISPTLWSLYVFFVSVSIIIFLIIEKLSKVRPAKFISSFMLTTFLKLVFFFIVLIIYVFNNKSDAVAFIINFSVLYFAYSAFEVYSVVSFLNKSRIEKSNEGAQN